MAVAKPVAKAPVKAPAPVPVKASVSAQQQAAAQAAAQKAQAQQQAAFAAQQRAAAEKAAAQRQAQAQAAAQRAAAEKAARAQAEAQRVAQIQAQQAQAAKLQQQRAAQQQALMQKVQTQLNPQPAPAPVQQPIQAKPAPNPFQGYTQPAPPDTVLGGSPMGIGPGNVTRFNQDGSVTAGDGKTYSADQWQQLQNQQTLKNQQDMLSNVPGATQADLQRYLDSGAGQRQDFGNWYGQQIAQQPYLGPGDLPPGVTVGLPYQSPVVYPTNSVYNQFGINPAQAAQAPGPVAPIIGDQVLKPDIEPGPGSLVQQFGTARVAPGATSAYATPFGG